MVPSSRPRSCPGLPWALRSQGRWPPRARVDGSSLFSPPSGEQAIGLEERAAGPPTPGPLLFTNARTRLMGVSPTRGSWRIVAATWTPSAPWGRPMSRGSSRSVEPRTRFSLRTRGTLSYDRVSREPQPLLHRAAALVVVVFDMRIVACCAPPGATGEASPDAPGSRKEAAALTRSFSRCCGMLDEERECGSPFS